MMESLFRKVNLLGIILRCRRHWLRLLLLFFQRPIFIISAIWAIQVACGPLHLVPRNIILLGISLRSGLKPQDWNSSIIMYRFIRAVLLFHHFSANHWKNGCHRFDSDQPKVFISSCGKLLDGSSSMITRPLPARFALYISSSLY